MRTLNIILIVSLFSLIVISCNNENKKNLILTIENKELKAGKKYKGVNVIRYSITNKSDKVFYINNLTQNINIPKSVTKERKMLRVFNNKNEVNYFPVFDKKIEKDLKCSLHNSKQKEIDALNLNYKTLTLYQIFDLDKVNFFIYPNQTIYFEYYISIDNPKLVNNQVSFADLNKKSNECYHAILSIASDSLNYKKILPRDVLKTIEANNVKIYHGIIESVNKVPIKVIN